MQAMTAHFRIGMAKCPQFKYNLEDSSLMFRQRLIDRGINLWKRGVMPKKNSVGPIYG